MKNWYRIFRAASVGVVAFVLLAIVSTLPASISAATVLIRPASQQNSGTAVPVLVQFTPSVNGIETGVLVSVDTAWSVSPTAGSLTTTTASLPSGITPWPGIGTASTVTGQNIQFPSGDLATGTTYGFYITGGIGSNPSGPHTRAYLWRVTTLNGLSTVEQSNEAAVPVQSNNQIQITASVLPQPSDLAVTIEAVNPPTGDIPPDTTLDYTITYENLYSSSTPLTVQSSWSLGTLEGTSTANIDILSYVPGTATDGYNSTTPVIDTLARTITWTIAQLPTASGPQTVNFSLKTNNYDSAGKQVSFAISGSAIAPVSTVPDEVTQIYRAASAPPPAPTPTPTPTPSISTTPSTTPTPTPAPAGALTITSVQMQEITDNSATFQVTFSQPATATVSFYPSLSSSIQTIQNPQLLSTHTILLPRLTRKTHYIFTVIGQSANGQQVTSDRFTFLTASSPPPSQPISNIRLTSGGVLIASIDQSNPPTITIPTNNNLEVSLVLAPDTIVQSFVLQQQLNDWRAQSPFEQTVSREFIARLSPTSLGTLQLFTQLLDSNGNLSTLALANLILISPLNIQDTQGRPIEFARVLVKKYNPDTRLYEVIPANSILQSNPLASDARGFVPMILPIGNYQFEVSAPGFQAGTHSFALTADSLYPVITLESEILPFIGRLRYLIFVANQTLELYLLQLRGSAISPSLYALAAFLTTTFFLLLATLALTARTHISLWMLPNYIRHRSYFFAKMTKDNNYYVRGQLISKDTKLPISRAAISLLDAQTDEVLAMLVSDRNGYFHWRTSTAHLVKGQVTALGFMAYDLDFSTDSLDKPLVFELEENPTASEARVHRLMAVGESVLGSLFEALLVIAVVLQVFFFDHTSVAMQALLIAGTIINLTVWSLFQTTPRDHQLHRR